MHSGLIKRTFALIFSSLLASIASALVCAGAGLWTVAISQARQINTLQLAGSQTPLGIYVDSGLGLTLTWAAFGCMTAALVPYWIRCGFFLHFKIGFISDMDGPP